MTRAERRQLDVVKPILESLGLPFEYKNKCGKHSSIVIGLRKGAIVLSMPCTPRDEDHAVRQIKSRLMRLLEQRI